jgi:hypothetical protein
VTIPEQFSALFERMKVLFMADESLLSCGKAVDVAVQQLSEADVRQIANQFIELGVKFWAHTETKEPLTGLPAWVLELQPGKCWTAMAPLNLNMSVGYLRQRITDFFSHFMANDEEVAVEHKKRMSAKFTHRDILYPFGAPSPGFALPGYNC